MKQKLIRAGQRGRRPSRRKHGFGAKPASLFQTAPFGVLGNAGGMPKDALQDGLPLRFTAT